VSAAGGSGGGAGTGSGSGGAGTGSGGSGGNTGPTRAALRIDDEPRAGDAIRALLRGRQVGYAVPIERGRYLVRLPDSCAAPFEDRDAALAALMSLAPRTTGAA
jgi:hypothetical protein